jgi:ketosteroid isomerase-like protein
MSEENVEIIREAWKAWMRGDPTELGDLSFIDTEVLYEDDTLPDHVGETYRGYEGLRRAWARFTEPWEEFENDLEWARDAGDAVVSCHRVRMRGKGSGVEGEARYAYVWRFREGRVVYLKSYGDPAEALEAAGLPE